MITLLEEIRNALVAPPSEVFRELLEECLHPEERRVSLRAMGSGEHWKCGDCGYIKLPSA